MCAPAAGGQGEAEQAVRRHQRVLDALELTQALPEQLPGGWEVAPADLDLCDQQAGGAEPVGCADRLRQLQGGRLQGFGLVEVASDVGDQAEVEQHHMLARQPAQDAPELERFLE